MKVKSEVTILIPTLNRHANLVRYLPYLATMGMDIVVADGSYKPFYCTDENILYLHLPNASFKNRLYALYSAAKTKYVVVAADDDLIGWNGLNKCIQFLIDNEDHSACQGYFTEYQYKKILGSNILINNSHSYGYSHDYTFNAENAVERLNSMTTNRIMHYCYAVVQKDVLSVMYDLWRDVESKDGDTILFEPLMMFAIGIVGKFKTLDTFYIARDISHGGNFSSFEYILSEGSNEECLSKNFTQSIIKYKGSRADVERIIKNYSFQLSYQVSARTNVLSNLIVLIKTAIKDCFIFLNIIQSNGIKKDYFKNELIYKDYLNDWDRVKGFFKA